MMRMGELSRQSGVSIATIKYYIREGLLEPGEPIGRNQALYGDQHLRRLDLVRALRDAANLPIATIDRVLTAMDSYRSGDRPDHLSDAVSALSEPVEISPDDQPEFDAAETDVSELLRELGWNVDPDSPGRVDLVLALMEIRRHLPGIATGHQVLRPYAAAVRELAEVEIPTEFDPASNVDDVLRFSILGTVLFEPVLLALRKLAHVDRLRQLPASTWASPSQ